MSEKLQGGLVVGSVDVSAPVILRSTTDNTEVTGKAYGDVTASYWRQGGVRVDVPAITLAAVNSAHADGGFKEVDSTNTPGLYRFDLPDAAAAAGADWVVLTIQVSGCYDFFQRFDLTVDLSASSAAALSFEASENVVTLAEVKAHLNLQSTFTTDDSLLYLQILVAVEYAQAFTGRRFVEQTQKIYLDRWAGIDTNRYFIGGFYLPFGQLQSVTHIKYTDTDEDQTTWADTEYDVDIRNEPGRVVLAYNKSFPTASLYPTNPIEVQFVCGWYQGDTWALDTVYALGDVVIPSVQTGFAYECTAAGTSDSTEPTWGKIIEGTTVDNTATWTCRKAVPTRIKQAVLLLIADMYNLREPTLIGVMAQTLKTAENLLLGFRLWEF